MTKTTLITVVIAMAAACLGIIVQHHLRQNDEQQQQQSLQNLHQEWKGKVIMLNFWATWCPPCREEIPDFIQLQTDLGDKGLQVVGVALDRPEMIAEFIAEFPLNYPNIILEGGEGFASLEAYGNTLGTLPFTVFIDREGNIVSSHGKGVLSYEEAASIIEPML